MSNKHELTFLRPSWVSANQGGKSFVFLRSSVSAPVSIETSEAMLDSNSYLYVTKLSLLLEPARNVSEFGKCASTTL